MKMCFILGTRPEIIKLSPVIAECEHRGIPYVIMHTGQHYSHELNGVFFKELGLREPEYRLGIQSNAAFRQSEHTGRMLIEIETVLLKEKPDVVLVQGDTNTVLAAALCVRKLRTAPSYLQILLGHVEAGLRSFDKTMTEELNRIVAGHLADIHFAPSELAKAYLKQEVVPDHEIYVVGNTIVDAIRHALPNIESSHILKRLDLTPNGYFFATAHRQENVDDRGRFEGILEGLGRVHAAYGLPVIYSLHPRAEKMLKKFNLSIPKGVRVVTPVGFFDSLCLEKNARLILTDSGGLQEEASELHVPCVTLRDNTERPETVHAGFNTIAGTVPERIVASVRTMLAKPFDWRPLYGDGDTASKIIDTIEKIVAKQPGANLEHQKGSDSGRATEPAPTVSVIGLGYIGLPTALLLAASGCEVYGYDIDVRKISLLKEGKLPFTEPGLNELYARAKDRFVPVDAPHEADVFILCVPTPVKQDKTCDDTFVRAAAESIVPMIRPGALVILESTVAPGTTEHIVCPILEKSGFVVGRDLFVGYVSEKAIPGSTIREMMQNDRIVAGMNQESTERIRALYARFVTGQIHVTDCKTAETVKLVENAYRDVNIAFANDLAKICETNGLNVWDVIAYANKHPRVNVHQPGPGVGGHCIALDPWFLIQTDHAHSALMQTARAVNDAMPEYVVAKAKNIGDQFKTKTIGILGVAYKKNVDDARETPALSVIRGLEREGFHVLAHDPLVTRFEYQLSDLETLLSKAEGVMIITDHDAYRNISLPPSVKWVLDTRGLLRGEKMTAAYYLLGG